MLVEQNNLDLIVLYDYGKQPVFMITNLGFFITLNHTWLGKNWYLVLSIDLGVSFVPLACTGFMFGFNCGDHQSFKTLKEALE